MRNKDSVGPFESPLPKGFKFIEMNPPAETVVWEIKTSKSKFLARGTLSECKRFVVLLGNAMNLTLTFSFHSFESKEETIKIEEELANIKTAFEEHFRHYIQL